MDAAGGRAHSCFTHLTGLLLQVISLIWPIDECGCSSSKGLEKVEIIANLRSFEQHSLLDYKETLFSQTGNHIIEEVDGFGSAYRVHPIVHSYIVHNLMPEKALIRVRPFDAIMVRLPPKRVFRTSPSS